MKNSQALLCAICVCFAGFIPQAVAAAETSVVIVASGSRAMAGRIKGGRKFVAFRDAALAAIDSLPADSFAGLLSYGEAPARKCEDISDVTPLARVAQGRGALKNALQKLQVKSGRAPQIAAIARAGELLKQQQGGGDKAILLVAGGADDCVEDPCAASKAFQILNPGIPVHVIALSPQKAERARLQCIADNTGGLYGETLDAASVLPQFLVALKHDAAARPTLPESAVDPVVVTPPVAAASAQTPAFETPPLPERNPGVQTVLLPRPEPNIVMRASLAPGSPPLQQGVAWRVYAAKVSAKSSADYADDKPVWTGAGAEPTTTLAPGRYHVQADYGFVSRGQDIQVESGATAEASVTLHAGLIEARAFSKPGSTPLDQMFYILYADAPGGQQEIGRSSRSDAVFYAPAGLYRLIGQHGAAEADARLVLEAGKTVRADIVMNSGVLKAETRTKAAGPLMQQVFYYVYEGEAKDGREIARSASPEPVFRLTSGTYRIVAQYDLAKTEKVVTIAAGQEAQAQLVMDGAGLKLSARLAGTNAPLTRDLQYTLYKLDGAGVESTEEIGRYASLGREIFVRSGRYRVESKYGYQNAIQAAEISIAPGETRELAIEHRAGDIKLALVAKPGGLPIARARWTVTDDTGAVVLTTTQSLPQLILKSGKYRATAQFGGKDYAQDFEVLDRDNKTVEVETK